MMKRLVVWLIPLAVVFVIVLGPGHNAVQVQAQTQTQPGAGFAAIPGAKGGQDTFGAYDVVKGWPKDISTLPGNEKWTWGAGQSVYAESPNRVFLLIRGELPNLRRPQSKDAARVRSEHSISHRPSALARRHHCLAAGRRSQRLDSRSPHRRVVGHRRRRCEMGELHHRRGRQRQHRRALDPMGQNSCSARITWPSILTIRRSTFGSWTITWA